MRFAVSLQAPLPGRHGGVLVFTARAGTPEVNTLFASELPPRQHPASGSVLSLRTPPRAPAWRTSRTASWPAAPTTSARNCGSSSPLDDTARFLADGQYRNPGGDPANFTTSYFHRPEELADEIKNAGLELSQIVAASGNVKLLPGLSQLLDIAESRDHVLSVLRLLEAEPSLIGMSQNFVAIAQAPAGD